MMIILKYIDNIIGFQNTDPVSDLNEKENFIDDDLELALDNLTDQLINAFNGPTNLSWENGKPEKFRELTLLIFIQQK